jgi:hypothetical protein
MFDFSIFHILTQINIICVCDYFEFMTLVKILSYSLYIPIISFVKGDKKCLGDELYLTFRPIIIFVKGDNCFLGDEYT